MISLNSRTDEHEWGPEGPIIPGYTHISLAADSNDELVAVLAQMLADAKATGSTEVEIPQ